MRIALQRFVHRPKWTIRESVFVTLYNELEQETEKGRKKLLLNWHLVNRHLKVGSRYSNLMTAQISEG